MQRSCAVEKQPSLYALLFGWHCATFAARWHAALCPSGSCMRSQMAGGSHQRTSSEIAKFVLTTEWGGSVYGEASTRYPPPKCFPFYMVEQNRETVVSVGWSWCTHGRRILSAVLHLVRTKDNGKTSSWMCVGLIHASGTQVVGVAGAIWGLHEWRSHVTLVISTHRLTDVWEDPLSLPRS
jgi:hypothetical protein